MTSGRRPARGDMWGSGQWLVVAAGVAFVLALAFAGGAFFLFRQPSEKPEFVERLRYEHVTSIAYTVATQPAVIYPEGKVGPVTAGPDGTAASPAPPIYTKLARTLDVTFDYNLKAQLPIDVKGEVSASLEVKAGKDGWSQTTQLLAPRAFAGTSVTGSVSIDVQRVLALIDTIEKETGFNAGTYDLAVVPRIQLAGRIGQESIEQTYSVPFVFKINRTQLIPDPQLVRSDVRRIGETVLREASVSILGWSLAVSQARLACLVGTAVALIVALCMGVMFWRRLRHDEVARLRTRYGVEVVAVAGGEFDGTSARVRLASVEDLARLAKRNGGLVFRQQRGPDAAPIYFVQEGEVIYCADDGVGPHEETGRPAGVAEG